MNKTGKLLLELFPNNEHSKDNLELVNDKLNKNTIELDVLNKLRDKVSALRQENEVEAIIYDLHKELLDRYQPNRRLDRDAELTYKIMRELCCIRINGVNYYKDINENIWKSFVSFETFKSAISNQFKELQMSDLNKITKWSKIIYDRVSFDFSMDERYVLFSNGYIDLKSDISVLVEWNDKNILTLLPIDFIPYNYTRNPSYSGTLMHQFLNWCAKGDPEEYLNILIMLGIVASNMRVEYFFNLYGVSGSGKSTLLDLAKQLVGHKYCVDKPIAKLNERFQLIPLINKKLFYNGDASNDEIDPSMLKLLTTTGHIWDIEVKGENTQISMKLPLNVIINSNHILNFKDFVGIDRRIVPIHFPFKQTHRSSNFSPLDTKQFNHIKPQIGGRYDFTKEAVESVIPVMVDALRMFFNNGKKIKLSSLGASAVGKIEKANNNLLQFAEEYDLLNAFKQWPTSRDFYYIKATVLYDNYVSIIKANNGKVKGKNSFLNDLDEYFRVNGYSIKINHQIRGLGKGFIAIPKDVGMQQEYQNIIDKINSYNFGGNNEQF